MSRSKIFIWAWAVFLTVLAVLFYLYVAVFGKPRVGKLNIFAPENQEELHASIKSDGWFGLLSNEKDLYPAKEADLHIDLGEAEKNFLITIDRLNSTSLATLEQNLKDLGIVYRVVKDGSEYKVEIDSTDKQKMHGKLEVIKTLNLATKVKN